MRKLFIVALALVAVLGLASSASAKSRDRNHDRIPDRWERVHHLSLKVNQAKRTRTATASRTGRVQGAHGPARQGLR